MHTSNLKNSYVKMTSYAQKKYLQEYTLNVNMAVGEEWYQK